MSACEPDASGEFKTKKEFVPAIGPAVGCISAAIGWLAFILVYALDWSRSFDLFQNLIVTVVSLAVSALIMCGVMLAWYRPNGELRRSREN